MVRFTWFARWLLVGFLGLTTFSVFAQGVTSTEAYTSCLTSYSNWSTAVLASGKCGDHGVDYEFVPSSSGCQKASEPSKFYTYNQRINAVYCSTGDSHFEGPTIAECSDNVEKGGCASFYFSSFDGDPESNKCADVQSFDSSLLRAGTANGSGGTCYNGCSYNVSVGYSGTWPAGHMENSFVPTGHACNGEPAATSDAPQGPLDVPGQTPDSSVNPSDGQKTGPDASGGLTCDSPPACTGDAIACNQLYQSWAGRCKEGKDVDLSGVESRLNTLHSDNLDTQSRLDTLHSDNVAIKGGLNELHNDNGYLRTGLNQLHNDNSDVFSSNGEVGDVSGVRQKIVLSPDSLDQSGFGFSRSCFIEPIHVAVGSGFVDVNFSDYCDILVWVGYLVVAFASFLSCYILIRV